VLRGHPATSVSINALVSSAPNGSSVVSTSVSTVCDSVKTVTKGVARVLQGYHKGVTKVLQGCHKSVKRMLHYCYDYVTSVPVLSNALLNRARLSCRHT
jgi:hypothetical protein